VSVSPAGLMVPFTDCPKTMASVPSACPFTVRAHAGDGGPFETPLAVPDRASSVMANAPTPTPESATRSVTRAVLGERLRPAASDAATRPARQMDPMPLGVLDPPAWDEAGYREHRNDVRAHHLAGPAPGRSARPGRDQVHAPASRRMRWAWGPRRRGGRRSRWPGSRPATEGYDNSSKWRTPALAPTRIVVSDGGGA
jgi:hypothetical protein